MRQHDFLLEQVTQTSLQWRHNGHQPYDCSLNRLFRRGSKKTTKFRVTGICEANSPVTREFPAEKASNAENDSIWWRHDILLNMQAFKTHVYEWQCSRPK